MAKKRLQKKRAAIATKKVEAAKIETKKIEPIKVETTKTEAVKIETAKTEPMKVETSKVEPTKIETTKTEPVKVETSKVEAAKIETAKTEPVKIETEKVLPSVDWELYESRFNRHYNELKWLYCEDFEDNALAMNLFGELTALMRNFYETRSAALQASDKAREAAPDWYRQNDLLAMSLNIAAFSKTFKGAEEKLDYIRECNVNLLHITPMGSAAEFTSFTEKCHKKGISVCVDFHMKPSFRKESAAWNEMFANMLALANQGADMLRLVVDSELPNVGAVVRMMRILCEIVCPGVIFVGAKELAPECQILTDKDLMTSLWNTVATADTALLRKEVEAAAAAEDNFFQNFLRCENAICWNLDYDFLHRNATEETPHRQYLNEFFSGSFPNSFARGELIRNNENPEDARVCGTTASLCGIERFGFEGNAYGVERGIRFDTTLHAFLLSQSGLPLLYSGDEIGQLNDYSYKNDAAKAADPRNLHRGDFDWNLADNRKLDDTVQGRLFPALDKLEKIRAGHEVFRADAKVRTIDSWDASILALVRETETEKFIGLYNFCGNDRIAWINEEDGLYTDLISGHTMEAKAVMVPAYGCFWLCRKK